MINSEKILNHNENMSYRRFGKTEQHLSCITLGGMRYVNSGGDPRQEPSGEMIEQCARITSGAFERGINHIETAYGYGKSEYCYGKTLNEVLKIPRDSYHLMTKGSPDTAEGMRKMVDEQLEGLQTDYIDLYGWHGINNREKLEIACKKGGPVEELLKMQEEGIIRSVGFSTHAQLDVIIDAIATGLFSFVNLHYYYFLQRNRGAVDYANAKDLGVFIISPNDKGGKLYEPSDRLKGLCAPLTPIQFNAKWCLNHPHIHTLSFGFTENSHFEEMSGIFPLHVPLNREELEIECRMHNALLEDPPSAYEGHELENDPSGINLSEVLRHRRMWKCYDQQSFGFMRYNMFQEKGDWFPGSYATPEAVQQIRQTTSPVDLDLKSMISETHEHFYRESGAEE